MAANLDAEIWGVMAASGSGKGLFLKGWLRKAKPRRLIIWDFKKEYDEFAPLASTLAEVRSAILKAGANGPLRLRFKPTAIDDKGFRKQFETLCALVQAWGNCTFIAEELSNVTMPSWAPPAWRMMTTGGRHEGIHIVGTSQNPASIDKQFLSNCTLIHVGQLHEWAHRRAVEKSMDVHEGDLADLVQFQYVQKIRKTGQFATGVVVPPGVAPPPKPMPPTPRGRGRAAPSQRGHDAPTMAPSSTPTARNGPLPRRGSRPSERKRP